MAKIKLQGNASGTGVLTVTAPNTSTDRTITLPDSTATLFTDAGGTMTGALTVSSDLNVNGEMNLTNSSGINYIDFGGSSLKFRNDNSTPAYEDMLILTKDGSVEATHNGSKKFETTATGIAVTGGVAIGGTGAANTLDDYEEGTFTPNVGGDATYTNQNGSYTKVGRLVTVKINFQVNAINSSGKNIIYGLPFTSTSGAAHVGSVGYYSGLSVSPTWIGCYGDANNTQITFIWNTGNSLTIGANGQNLFQNSARIDLSLTYQTT